jgi:hypothetical protein
VRKAISPPQSPERDSEEMRITLYPAYYIMISKYIVPNLGQLSLNPVYGPYDVFYPDV